MLLVGRYSLVHFCHLGLDDLVRFVQGCQVVPVVTLKHTGTADRHLAPTAKILHSLVGMVLARQPSECELPLLVGEGGAAVRPFRQFDLFFMLPLLGDILDLSVFRLTHLAVILHVDG